MRRALLILALLATACSAFEPRGANRERRPAVIADDSTTTGEPVIEAPDTVLAGLSYLVTVRSLGGGCIDQGDTQTTVSGLVAEMRPYDLFPTSRNEVCDLLLAVYRHSARITFSQPGVATIRAIGRSSSTGQIVGFERTVIVR